MLTAADFLPELAAVDELRPHPRNYRTHPDEQLDHLMRSIELHGFYRNVVVANDGTILAGHGVVLAARRLGLDTIPVYRLDVEPDSVAAMQVLAGDNEIPRLAGNDARALAELLADLSTIDVDALLGTGYDAAALDKMLAEFDDEQLDEIERPLRYTFTTYDREAIAEAAFAYWRARGFPYPEPLPLHVAMLEINALAAVADDELPTTRLGYHVADGYQPHRLDVAVTGKLAPSAVFADDRRLMLAIIGTLDDGNTFADLTFRGRLSMTRGGQPASNYRPGFALSLLRRYAPPGATLLDTSTGFGGRLVGFLASDCTRYVGIDPSTRTHAGNERLAAALCPPDKRVELLCAPAEDVAAGSLPRCDVALTSPPYFVKELYADEPTQSCVRYQQIEQWRDGFLVPMLRLQHDVLVEGAASIVNIADVVIGSRTYPLVDMTCDAARAVGFDVEAIEQLRLSHRWGAHQSDEVAVEPVIVLRRGPDPRG